MKQSDIREENLREVYEYVLHHSNVSRAKIARELGLSRPSSSSLVDELIFSGALYEDGSKEEDGCVGRNPYLIKTDFRKLYCLVLFWKAEGISVSVVSMGQGLSVEERLAGSVFSEISKPADYGKRTVKIIHRLRSSIEEKNAYLGSLIILPGIVDSAKKNIVSPDLGIDRELGRKIIEDMKESGEALPAIFEESLIRAYSALRHLRREEENSLYLRLSDSLSGVYFLKRENRPGPEGRAFLPGQCILNMYFPHNSRLLGPEPKEKRNTYDILDKEIGEKPLREEILKYYGKQRELLQSLEEEGTSGNKEGKYYHFLQSSKERDPEFYSLVKEKYLYYLSLIFTNCSSLLSSKTLILGGFFSLFGEEFKEELKKEIKEKTVGLSAEDPEIHFIEESEQEIEVSSSDYLFSRYYHFTEGKIGELPFA